MDLYNLLRLRHRQFYRGEAEWFEREELEWYSQRIVDEHYAADRRSTGKYHPNPLYRSDLPTEEEQDRFLEWCRRHPQHETGKKRTVDKHTPRQKKPDFNWSDSNLNRLSEMIFGRHKNTCLKKFLTEDKAKELFDALFPGNQRIVIMLRSGIYDGKYWTHEEIAPIIGETPKGVQEIEACSLYIMGSPISGYREYP